jgi:hypothetical protein
MILHLPEKNFSNPPTRPTNLMWIIQEQVILWLKARIVKPAETAIARE